jgi:hypothetical protein
VSRRPTRPHTSRDWYFPTAPEASEAFDTLWEKCGEVYNEVNEKLGNMTERTRWADYVELVGH